MLSVSQKQELNEDTGAQCMGWGRVRHSKVAVPVSQAHRRAGAIKAGGSRAANRV